MIKIEYHDVEKTEQYHLLYVWKRIHANIYHIYKAMTTPVSKKTPPDICNIVSLAKKKWELLCQLEEEEILLFTPHRITSMAISNDLEGLADISENMAERYSKDEFDKRSELIQEILDYKNFYAGLDINTHDGVIHWNRERLIRSANTQVCAYCGRQYISGLKNGTIASCDHYYPKERFPILSINMYNLIPSCHACNSVLKGKKVQKKSDRHLYPYQDDTDTLLFSFSTENTEELKNVSPEYNVINITCQDKSREKQAEQSVKIFKLDELYQSHCQEAYELRRALSCSINESYQKLFKGNFKDLECPAKELEAYAFSYRNKEATAEPLVKFKKDIEKQFLL